MKSDDMNRRLEEDRGAFAAFAAAAGAAAIGGDGPNPWWPMLGREQADEIGPSGAAVLDVLAPFVREHGDVPSEALFRHAAAAGVHDKPADGFAALPIGDRLAYSTFLDVLVKADRLAAAEAELEARQNRTIPKAEFLPLENTILAPASDPMQLEGELLRELDRPMKIIPGTGLPAGHVPTPRPAPPPVESNITRPHVQFAHEPRDGSAGQVAGVDVPEDADPRAAIALGMAEPGPEENPAIAGAPAIGGVLAPGGAVGQAEDGAHPLGHGFDPAAPFQEGPAPYGQRNAIETGTGPAAEPASPQTPRVPAPGEQTGEPIGQAGGVEDPLGLRNAPELGASIADAGAGDGEPLPIETRHVQDAAPNAPENGDRPAAEPASPQNPNVPAPGASSPEDAPKATHKPRSKKH